MVGIRTGASLVCRARQTARRADERIAYSNSTCGSKSLLFKPKNNPPLHSSHIVKAQLTIDPKHPIRHLKVPFLTARNAIYLDTSNATYLGDSIMEYKQFDGLYEVLDIRLKAELDRGIPGIIGALALT